MKPSVARTRALATIAFVSALVCGAGCSRQTNEPLAAQPAASHPVAPGDPQQDIELEVWVPCAYASAMTELSSLFEQQHPNVSLSQRVENVAVLAPRIAQGASPDVFMCVGDREVKALEDAGRVEYRKDFCFINLGIVTPKGNPAGVHSLKDLTKDSVKQVGVGAEDISVGYYARQLLKDAGVWEDMKDKVVESKMPIHLLQDAAKGKVDASIAYAVCLRAKKGEIAKTVGLKLELVDDLEEDFCFTIPCPAIAAKGCPHLQEARQFIDFLTTDEAQEVIDQYGFLPLKEPKCY